MAGSYPDVPGQRFAYHLDQTLAVYRNHNGDVTNIDGSRASMNDFSTSNYYRATTSAVASNMYIALVFPELRDLDGYYVNVSSSREGDFVITDVETSTDSVDGVGGTWSSLANPWQRSVSSPADWRTITGASASGIRAIRFTWDSTSSLTINNDFRAIHLYGNITSGQTPDRLRAWHPTLDQEADPAHFDFGDMAQGTTSVIQFRVRNNSSGLTANSITISQDDIPAGGMGLEFSTDGSAYSTSINIGNLASSTTSSVLYVRRSVGAAEAVQLRSSLIKAIPTSWT